MMSLTFGFDGKSINTRQVFVLFVNGGFPGFIKLL
jgi:hypothetical protein